MNAFQSECAELDSKLSGQMNSLREKFHDDNRDFEKMMRVYIDNKVSLFMQGIENKVEGNEIMVNSGTTDTSKTLNLIRKNISELQS
jgi:LEA14-like dessication related protein